MGLLDIFRRTDTKLLDDTDTDYINTRFLNWYAVGQHINYPQWFEYECGITDAKAKENQMIQRGLLCHSANNKGATDCELTGDGITFLEEHKEILIAESYRKYEVSIEDYYAEKNLLSENAEPIEILFSILEKRKDVYIKKKMFGFLRNIYLCKAQVYEKNKNFPLSLQYYIFTLRYDLSGLGNDSPISRDNVNIPPAIIKAIYKHRNHYNPSMIANCQGLYIPQSLTSEQTFQSIVKKIINNEPLPKNIRNER